MFDQTSWWSWCLIVPIALAGIAILICILAAYDAACERQQEEAALRERAEQCRCYEEEQRLSEERKRLEREERERQAEQTQLAVAKAVDAIRAAAAERYKPAAAAGSLAERDEWMKEASLVTERLGRALTVRVLTSPTGRMVMEWMVDPRFPRSLKISCHRRDGSVVFIDYGPRGTFHETLVRGRDHWFFFHAHDGDRDEEPNFGFTVKIETPRQRDRTVEVLPPKPVDEVAEKEQRIRKRIESISAAEQLWADARRKEHERIDAEGGSEPERKHKKATSDANLLEEREREERGN